MRGYSCCSVTSFWSIEEEPAGFCHCSLQQYLENLPYSLWIVMDSMIIKKKNHEPLNAREPAMKTGSYCSSVSTCKRVKVCFCNPCTWVFPLCLFLSYQQVQSLHPISRVIHTGQFVMWKYFLSYLLESNEDVMVSNRLLFPHFTTFLLSCKRLAFLFVDCLQSTAYGY